MRPKKRLGQHFLGDQRVLQRIADSLELTGAETVVEIGPGRGAHLRLLARLRTEDPRCTEAGEHCVLVWIGLYRPSADELLASAPDTPPPVPAVALLGFPLAPAEVEPLPAALPADLCRRVRDAFSERGIEISAVSGTFNAIHPDRAWFVAALRAGITTVIDNSHNSRTAAHSDAAVEAGHQGRVEAGAEVGRGVERWRLKFNDPALR